MYHSTLSPCLRQIAVLLSVCVSPQTITNKWACLHDEGQEVELWPQQTLLPSLHPPASTVLRRTLRYFNNALCCCSVVCAPYLSSAASLVLLRLSGLTAGWCNPWWLATPTHEYRPIGTCGRHHLTYTWPIWIWQRKANLSRVGGGGGKNC